MRSQTFKSFCQDHAEETVLYRADFNVPIQKGTITDDTRLRRTLPGIKALLDARCKVVLVSHLGRPKSKIETVVPDDFDLSLQLRPVSDALTMLLGREVRFCPIKTYQTWKQNVEEAALGSILLLDNIRFFQGEEQNDESFARFLSQMATAYVSDAFACVHRAHASMVRCAQLLPATPGPLVRQEVEALGRYFERPASPSLAIVGGAKVSTKLPLLSSLAQKMDMMMIGGGMANTLLAAQGHAIGKSLYEPDCLEISKEFLATTHCRILLPKDVMVARDLTSKANVQKVGAQIGEKAIFDIGAKTRQAWEKVLNDVATVFWNGPLGVFEAPGFEDGSFAIARCVARKTQQNTLKSIAGGGDTIALLSQAGVLEEFSYVSSAGGAFLEYIEGKTLPGLDVLSDSLR